MVQVAEHLPENVQVLYLHLHATFKKCVDAELEGRNEYDKMYKKVESGELPTCSACLSAWCCSVQAS